MKCSLTKKEIGLLSAICEKIDSCLVVQNEDEFATNESLLLVFDSDTELEFAEIRRKLRASKQEVFYGGLVIKIRS